MVFIWSCFCDSFIFYNRLYKEKEMKSKNILLFALLLFLIVLAACSIKKNECNLSSDCERGICPDGYEYNKYSCTDNICYENKFIADPCLNHYGTAVNECNLSSDCERGICPDGYEYNKYSCTDNICYENKFIADPCLNHYGTAVNDCSIDADCAAGGCSGQICGKKDAVKDIITTCEFKEEYGCLKLTSCGCENKKCMWKENKEY